MTIVVVDNFKNYSMNYTTVEQSKKLLELGLNSESADMFYLDNSKAKVPILGEYKIFDIPSIKHINSDELISIDMQIPCWSLGALLEVMPEIFEDENDRGCNPTLSKGYDTDMWHCLYRSTIYITDWYKSPTDAAFEMVVWLLENGYIKTEKK